jgi:SMODS-associated and fused to various effectors sensor domain
VDLLRNVALMDASRSVSLCHLAISTEAAIWRVTIPAPHNDFLKSKKQSQAFRKVMRQLMDRIKARHGEGAIIRVFPAMPVALAVEFGRILMPKVDLPLDVYDENKKSGGFVCVQWK